MPPDYVARRAVTLLASGPAGGVMGSTLAAQRAGVDAFVAVDMGGTSFDLCLVRGGRPEPVVSGYDIDGRPPVISISGHREHTTRRRASSSTSSIDAKRERSSSVATVGGASST